MKKNDKLKKYLEAMVEHAIDPDLKKHYQTRLDELNKTNRSKPSIKVWSEKLRKPFDSAYQASLYIGKSGGYVGNILSGRIKSNPYGFKKL